MANKIYRHTAKGLALYLGAECEYRMDLPNMSAFVENGEWVYENGPHTGNMDAPLLYILFECEEVEDFTLFLRQLDSISEDEGAKFIELAGLGNVTWHGYQERHSYHFVIGEWEEHYNAVYLLVSPEGHFEGFEGLEENGVKNPIRLGDWLRSHSFDIGGPCESSTDQGKTWREDWAESFINVGLAKLRA